MQTVSIENDRVIVSSPEGQTMWLPLVQLMDLVSPEFADAIYPDGVKRELRYGTSTIWVHQTPPRVHNLKWIATDSRTPFGRGARYRDVRIELPYIILMAAFVIDRSGRLQLSGDNECFFRNEPLRTLDDELCYPALLNCSKFDPDFHRPLSWVCTEHLDLAAHRELKNDNERMRQGLRDLLACLLETGFNYSSEHHELSSWFSESTGVDPRVSTIENWEAATRDQSMFALDIPWLPVGKSVREVADRMAERLLRSHPRVNCADDIARLVFNHGRNK